MAANFSYFHLELNASVTDSGTLPCGHLINTAILLLWPLQLFS